MLKKLISSWSWARAFRLAIVAAFPAVVIGWLWLFTWPHFEGEYIGNGGLTKVEVTSSRGHLQVTVSMRKDDAEQVKTFAATRHYTTLRFGEGIESGVVVFHPFSVESYDLVTGSSRIRLSKSTAITQLALQHPLVTLVVVAALMSTGMLIMIEFKAQTNPSVIHPMWLAFFSALIFSTLVLFVSGEEQIFDYDGNPRTAIARTIVAAANFFLDVIPECKMLIVTLTLFVLPQWLAYGMSGISGAARRSRFVWIAWKWVVLITAKSFISASAIALSISLVGVYYGWVSSEPRGIAASVLAALMLLGFGIALLCIVPTGPEKRRVAGKSVRRFHRHMRRRLRRGPGEIAVQLQRELHQPIGSGASFPCCNRITRFFRGV
ncbi:hypothetical protein [Paraburkholderia phenazinium]|uniref:hypothetical protein n=1 Tax=Paraburkholderia phenazinium TaxID=60549 RepID=UPI00158F2905|nr:hypothetical protein [Paraburkholderia phenazinium]